MIGPQLCPLGPMVPSMITGAGVAGTTTGAGVTGAMLESDESESLESLDDESLELDAASVVSKSGTSTGDGVATGESTGDGVTGTTTGAGVTGAEVTALSSQTAARPVAPRQPFSSPHLHSSIDTPPVPSIVMEAPAQEVTSLQSSSSIASGNGLLLMMVIEAPEHALTSSHEIFSSSVSVEAAVSSMVSCTFSHAKRPLHSTWKSPSGSVTEMVAP